MAAGKPVVSTSIRDVVRPYGEQRLVRIADEVPSFVRACIAAMAEDPTEKTETALHRLSQIQQGGQLPHCFLPAAGLAHVHRRVLCPPQRPQQRRLPVMRARGIAEFHQ